MKIAGICVVFGTGLLSESFAQAGLLGWIMYIALIIGGVAMFCARRADE